MTVLQRIRELGTLRTLGATRGTVMRTVLVEALAVGVAGTIVGLAFGLALASGLIAFMRGVGMPVGHLSVTPGPAITAAIVGLLVTFVGALRPARRAGRVEPIRAVLGASALGERPRPLRGLIGLALFLPGCILGGGSGWAAGTRAARSSRSSA